MMICDECNSELEHCHEILVVHIDGTSECLFDDCQGDRDVHEWTVSCLEVEVGCQCEKTPHAHPLAA